MGNHKPQTPKEKWKKREREKEQRSKSGIAKTPLSSSNQLLVTLRQAMHNGPSRYRYRLRSPLEHVGSIHRRLHIIALAARKFFLIGDDFDSA